MNVIKCELTFLEAWCTVGWGWVGIDMGRHGQPSCLWTEAWHHPVSTPANNNVHSVCYHLIAHDWFIVDLLIFFFFLYLFLLFLFCMTIIFTIFVKNLRHLIEDSSETQLTITIEKVSKQLDKQQQVGELILDFAKVFDTVPHQWLLTKLDYYGICGQRPTWINHWLIRKQQTVVENGCEASNPNEEYHKEQSYDRYSLLFLLYINHIGDTLGSS